MIHFYKPNAKVTGTACSFYLNKKDNAFFTTLIKQDGWDSNRRIGSFKKNKDNPNKRVNVKFSAVEIASIIDAIKSNRKFTGYHGSNQIARFTFGPYERDGKQIGFSFNVTKESKEDSTSKASFLIGFTFPEGELLSQHLSYILQESFKITDSAMEKMMQKNSYNDSAPPKQKEEPSELMNEDEDDLW
tara:strand:+ start:10618 stop:11181 length:564 start_codon:yes stop_codon:yes gene_type:complete